MSGVLHQRIRHSEEVTRNAMYQLLFNYGFLSLAFLAVLIICLLFLSRG